MKTFLILVTLLFLISNNLYASCKSGSFGKQITVMGWTPDEAYEKLHLELPKLGVLQNVELKSVKALSDNKYSEHTLITKSIKANIDMIATYHCKINNQYAITITIPDGKINYYPSIVADWLKRRAPDENDFFVRFWSLESAKRFCGSRDYSVITIDYRHAFDLRGAHVVHSFRDITNSSYIICGSGWEIYLYGDKTYKQLNNPYGYFKHYGRKYTQLYADFRTYEGEWSDYMELQMLHNAMN